MMRRLTARWRLSTRIVAMSLGLLLLVQGAALLALQHEIDLTLRSIDDRLERGERVWRAKLADRSRAQDAAGRVLALDDGLREAIASRDGATIVDALDNHRRRLGATLMAVLDPDFRLQWAHAGADVRSTGALAAAAQRRRSAGSAFELLDGRPFQLVIRPRHERDRVGWLVMAFALDAPLAAEFRELYELDLALVAERDGVREVVLSTLSGVDAAALAATASRHVRLGDEVYQTRVVRLLDAPPARLDTVLLRSQQQALAPYRDLQRALGAITLGGLLLFGLASLWLARRVTTPLASLVGAARRLGRGDYTQPVEHRERHDEVGELAQAFDQMREDIAANEAEVRRLAYTDHLTGLPSRARFRDALRGALLARAGATDAARDARVGGVAVLMLGLDRFKQVNGLLGQAFGDQVLKAVADRLRALPLRDGDRLARLGGDQFALLLVDTDRDAALAAAQRLAAGFVTPLVIDGQTVDRSASIGVAMWPADAADADALLARAEVALSAAKRRTVDVLAYDPSFDSTSAQTLTLLSELRRAVGEGELRLFLQPKLALADTGVVGAEALLRWMHPQRGLVPPMEFVPFAEQTGFVRELTLWVFEEAARRWESLRGDGAPLRIAVNLSVRDLLDAQLPAKLDAVLARHHVPPQAFCLEITESALMDDPQRAEATLQRLAERGFKLSIDDFGTGFSSLSYLSRLPVTELKIDRSFVMNLDRHERNAAIVRSTIHLAHDLGLSVVAEGVESAAVWVRLREWGCDEGQGYHMSKPLPADELPAWCRHWREKQAPGLRSRPSLTA